MRRGMVRIAPTEGYKRCGEVRYPPVMASPCQPPLGKGPRGRGDGCPCCGAQNFCAALRRTLEILTAATRSPRFSCHRQRSVRSPQPVTSVTGFAMTHCKECVGRADVGIGPYEVFTDRIS